MPDRFQILLEMGADARAIHLEDGNTPLHVAAANADVLTAELLVFHGADPSATNNQGETPAMHQLAAMSVAVVEHEDMAQGLGGGPGEQELAYALSAYVCGYACKGADGPP